MANPEHLAQKPLAKKVVNIARRPIVGKLALTEEEHIENYGFKRKSQLRQMVGILVVVGIFSFAAWVLVEFFQFEKVAWSQALTVALSFGFAIVAYMQWRATRQEISIDKYYDRLDVVNKRLEVLSDVDKRNMYVFAELDKLEYVIKKYELGYISPDLASRALSNFRAVCRNRPEFHKSALDWVETAGYCEETKQVVKNVCKECDSPAS